MWKEILRYAREKSVNVIFVTDDVKSDWWIDDNGQREFHPYLCQEFQRETQMQVRHKHLQTQRMTNPEPIPLGEYRGFTMELYFEAREYKVRLKGELGYPVTLGTDTFGNITRLDNALEGLPKRLEMNEMELDNIKKQFETAKVDVERPFPQEEELKTKTDRLNELNALLNVDKRENEIVGGEPDEGEEPPEKKPRDLER